MSARRRLRIAVPIVMAVLAVGTYTVGTHAARNGGLARRRRWIRPILQEGLRVRVRPGVDRRLVRPWIAQRL